MGKLDKKRMKILEELGEEALFERYLEAGSVGRMLEGLWENEAGAQQSAPGLFVFYKYLHASDERWSKWKAVQRMRGARAADEVMRAADDVTTENASARRVEIQTKQWIAERLAKEDFGGPAATVNVAVGVGGEWLDALRQLAAERKAIPVAEAEIVTIPPAEVAED